MMSNNLLQMTKYLWLPVGSPKVVCLLAINLIGKASVCGRLVICHFSFCEKYECVHVCVHMCKHMHVLHVYHLLTAGL